MASRQTVTKSQLDGAQRILGSLQREISAEFIGLVSTTGVSLLTLEPSGFIDADTLASLAASSFAATQQLALIMNETEFTVMFHEGSDLNIHIALVAPCVLLVVCFRRAADIGKVRVISKRSRSALATALGPDAACPTDAGADRRGDDDDVAVESVED